MSPHDDSAPKEQQVDGNESTSEMDGASTLGVLIKMGWLTVADYEYYVGRRPSDGKYYVGVADNANNTGMEVPFDGEDDAIKAFCALIVCDESDLTKRLEAIAEKFEDYIC